MAQSGPLKVSVYLLPAGRLLNSLFSLLFLLPIFLIPLFRFPLATGGIFCANFLLHYSLMLLYTLLNSSEFTLFFLLHHMNLLQLAYEVL